MQHDGSLVLPNSSIVHSGLYYCLLRHRQGATLWPYELHIGHHQQGSGCAGISFSATAGPQEDQVDGLSDEQFAAAVAASVLLTFVVGFSAGALTRTQVLRCVQGRIEQVGVLQNSNEQTTFCCSRN